MDMDIDVRVNKLDDTYLTSEELSKYIKERAEQISEDFEKAINNMKLHWHGTDATAHVNNWIDKYIEATYNFQDFTKIGKYLQNYFVVLQTGRLKLGSNKKVGDVNANEYHYNPIGKIDTTSEYYYDEQLKTDYLILQDIYNSYDEFVNKVELNMERILLNWEIGKIGRDKLIKKYHKAFISAQDLLVEMDELVVDLGTAIHNISMTEFEQRGMI